ncbi:hypothetical protein [Sphingomonas sp. AX6]|uniref:hypothetical protein n=1 Tax=Sphingomonas sp. AX6 TaxID=2653171 RepID=UPI001F158517|nr:hypothetical protein [Sphingomonas sp. AX6]
MAIPAPVLPEILPVAAAILAEVLTIAATILPEIARIFTAFLPKFATVDFALTEILTIVAAVVAQFAPVAAQFLAEIAAIFAAFLTEFLTRRLRVPAPVLAVLISDCSRTRFATFDALRLPLLTDLLALLNDRRVRPTFGLACLAHRIGLTLGLASLAGWIGLTCRGGLALCLSGLTRLLALLHLFGTRAAIAAFATILRQCGGGDQCGRADQRDQ